MTPTLPDAVKAAIEPLLDNACASQSNAAITLGRICAAIAPLWPDVTALREELAEAKGAVILKGAACSALRARIATLEHQLAEDAARRMEAWIATHVDRKSYKDHACRSCCDRAGGSDESVRAGFKCIACVCVENYAARQTQPERP